MSHSLSQSVDARLAAAAVAASQGNGTPKLQHQTQQQIQQQQHHHHHHHPSSSSAMAPAGLPQLPAKTKKQLQELASQPSQDREGYYDDDYEGEGISYDGYNNDDGEEDCSMYDINPKLSNRGNKLVPGSKFIRRGRLGGWENHEIFTSRSSFPSNHNPSSVNGAGGSAAASGSSHRLPSITGGGGGRGGRHVNHSQYHITPNLSLVPTSSTLAARPDRDIHLSSISPATGLPSISTYSSHSSKRRKLHTTHTGLASTSGPSANHTSAPLRAYLPIPPQNPIELVSSPLISRTFSSKNRTLEKLSLSATDLIEQDMPLLKALRRLVDFMRGTSTAGLVEGVVGLPFLGDEEGKMVIEGEKEEEQMENGVEAQINGSARQDEGQTTGMQLGSGANGATSRQGTPLATLTEIVEEAGAALTNGSNPRKRQRSEEGMELDGKLPTKDGYADTVEGKNSATAITEAAREGGEATANADIAVPQATKANGAAEDVKMDDTAVPTSAILGANVTSSEDAAAAATNGASVTAPLAVNTMIAGLREVDGDPSGPTTGGGDSRSSSPSSGNQQQLDANEDMDGSNDHDPDENENNEEGSIQGQQQHKSTRRKSKEPLRRVARPSDSVLRIADPTEYIQSLFVSNEDIWVPPQPGGGGDAQATNGQGTPAPLTGTESGVAAGISGTPTTTGTSTINGITIPKPAPSPTPATHTRISPVDQLNTVQLCLSELTKFLSDSLEYQDRLSEIRDQVLGVEKRRKGVWSMARGFAHQLVWEEEQAELLGNGGNGGGGAGGVGGKGKGRNGGLGDGEM